MSANSAASLTSNNDFASELLLNKIMNGQLTTSSNKTVTAGTRAAAAKLNADGLATGVIAANAAKGLVIASGTVNVLTEVLDQLKSLRNAISGASDSDKEALASTYKENFNKLLETEIEGNAVLGDTGEDVVIGSGGTVLTIAGVDLKNNEAFKDFLGALDDSSKLDNDMLDAAISEVTQLIAAHGSTATLLSNRVDMLNDLASTYADAANAQGITKSGSASSLLNAIL